MRQAEPQGLPVSCQCFFKQLALLGIHALGLGIKAPGLQAAQLKHDALNLGILELDGLGLCFDLLTLLSNMLALVTDVLEYLGGQFGSGTGAQTNKVLGLKFMHVEHVGIVRNPHKNVN